MSKKEDLKRVNFKSFSRGQFITFIILVILTFLISSAIPILLSSNSLFSVSTSKEYTVKELSDENLVSPISFSYIDEIETEKARMEAQNSVIPYFTYSYNTSLRMSRKAQSLYDYMVLGSSIEDSSLDEAKVILSSLLGRSDTVENAAILREGVQFFLLSGVFSSKDIEYMYENGYNTIYINGSSELKYTYSSMSRSVDDLMVNSNIHNLSYRWIIYSYPELELAEVQIIADCISLIVEANIFYDEVYTEAVIENARNSVEPVVVNIEKGDYILRVDTLVTEEQLKTIEVLNSKRVSSMSFSSVLPRFVISLSAIIIWFYYSVGLIQYEYRKAQYTIISLLFVLLSLLLGFFFAWRLIDHGFTLSDSLMPFIFLALIGCSITNSLKYGVSNVILLSILYSLWPNTTFFSIVYYVVSGIIVSYFSLKSNGRFDTISIALKCSVILLIVTLLFSLLTASKLYNLLFSLAGIVLNVIISFILYSIVLPILEKIFNIPTRQRLIEISYTDNATMTQLSYVAQGTYNHVKNVADLAYNAALAIGCNASLALAGAQYHDIGKMVHPEYFVENQSDKNAHDEISSQLSSSIIKSHVRLGVEKGKEIGLPEEVLDIISEHHGNDIIKYFYNEAVKNAGEKNTVMREDFMYDGDPPTTKESAIVMLADCTEAATRTIKRPNHQKYEKFISSIMIDKIAHGQLDNSGLTIKDLKAIKDAFIPILIGRDHHRISYNNDDDKD